MIVRVQSRAPVPCRLAESLTSCIATATTDGAVTMLATTDRRSLRLPAQQLLQPSIPFILSHPCRPSLLFFARGVSMSLPVVSRWPPQRPPRWAALHCGGEAHCVVLVGLNLGLNLRYFGSKAGPGHCHLTVTWRRFHSQDVQALRHTGAERSTIDMADRSPRRSRSDLSVRTRARTRAMATPGLTPSDAKPTRCAAQLRPSRDPCGGPPLTRCLDSLGVYLQALASVGGNGSGSGSGGAVAAGGAASSVAAGPAAAGTIEMLWTKEGGGLAQVWMAPGQRVRDLKQHLCKDAQHRRRRCA